MDYFAVSSDNEFFSVKKYVTKPIMILDPIYDKNTLKKLIDFECEFTVSNLKNLDVLLDISREVNKQVWI